MVANLHEIENFKHKPKHKKHKKHHGHHGHHRRRHRIINLATPIRYSPPVVINRSPRYTLLDIHTNLLAIIVIVLVAALLIYAMKK